MTIDVDATKKKIQQMRDDGKSPKIGMFGGSLFLFPHPVKEASSALCMITTCMLITTERTSQGLIGGGEFQDPIKGRSRLDGLKMSSYKTLWVHKEELSNH